MFNRILIVALTVASFANPTSAGQFVDQGHKSLIQAAQRAGVKYEVNPSDCPGDIDGFYTG